MISRNIWLILLFSGLLSSCGLLYEYRSLHEFEGMEWNKDQVETFDFEIVEKSNYNIEIIGRHLTGFPFKDINCSVGLQGEDHELKVMVIIPIIAEDGMYMSEGGGDFWDFEFSAINNIVLEPGNYAVTLNHEMNKNPLPLMMEIGIQVVKADK